MEEIEIKGTYSQTGFLLGQLHKGILKKIEEIVEKNINVENEKIKNFEKCIKKFTFLEEEIQSYCEGADIKLENLLKLKFGNFEIPKLSCTSLFLEQKFVDEKVKIAFKIRDQLPLPQYICKKQNFDKIPYFFSGSISDIGYGFFIKENGFIGINNTGSFLKDEFVNEYGFDDCDIMKIVAETCDKPEESIEIIRKMQKEKIIGCTGKKRGMIFLFGDIEKMIVIELNSFEINYKKIEEKFSFTNDFLFPESQKWVKKVNTEGTKSSKIRKKRIDEILNENEKFNIEKLKEISRDKKYYPYSICRDTKLMPVRTVSAFIAVFYKNPILWICLGQPYVSPFFPFSIKGNKILDKFISGEISVNLNKIFEKKQLNDDKLLGKIRYFEKELNKKFNEISGSEEKNLEIQKEVYNFIKESTI